MNITATEFRKDLFRVLESALDGESVDVTYKGRSLRVAPEKTPSKTSRIDRLKAKPLLPAENSPNLLEDMNEMARDLDSAWEKSWDEHLK